MSTPAQNAGRQQLTQAAAGTAPAANPPRNRPSRRRHARQSPAQHSTSAADNGAHCHFGKEETRAANACNGNASPGGGATRVYSELLVRCQPATHQYRSPRCHTHRQCRPSPRAAPKKKNEVFFLSLGSNPQEAVLTSPTVRTAVVRTDTLIASSHRPLWDQPGWRSSVFLFCTDPAASGDGGAGRLTGLRLSASRPTGGRTYIKNRELPALGQALASTDR